MLVSLLIDLFHGPDYVKDAEKWLRFDRSPMGRVQLKNAREVKALDAEINAAFRGTFTRGAK